MSRIEMEKKRVEWRRIEMAARGNELKKYEMEMNGYAQI